MTEPFIKRSAVISEDGKYRYCLRRAWTSLFDEERVCAFVMLNPSTADDFKDDPTVRRCIAYAQAWNCSELHIINLFALRATDPKALYEAADPIGSENLEHVQRCCERVMMASEAGPGMMICAWGNHGNYMEQDLTMLGWIEAQGIKPLCLKVNAATKQPAHPLYLPKNLKPTGYVGRSA